MLHINYVRIKITFSLPTTQLLTEENFLRQSSISVDYAETFLHHINPLYKKKNFLSIVEFAIVAVKINERIAVGCGDFFDFADEDRMVATFVGIVETAFEVGERVF